MYDGVEGSMYIIGTQTATVSRMLSLDFEKTWRIVDFQTGGPTVSPLLLIYMCWKSQSIPDLGPSYLPIHTHYDMVRPTLGLMQMHGVDESQV